MYEEGNETQESEWRETIKWNERWNGIKKGRSWNEGEKKGQEEREGSIPFNEE